MDIRYRVNAPLATAQFIELLASSTLGERRPIDDPTCMAGMLANSNLLVTAWDGDLPVGVARSITDFHYACYLSDLAVRRSHQNRGIGLRLQAMTQDQLGPRCKLILIAAPAANAYYPRLGYAHNPRCWTLAREDRLRD